MGEETNIASDRRFQVLLYNGIIIGVTLINLLDLASYDNNP
ncbi:hypothetical protein [Waterburya agarophytonicola]|nr:hypothetical protein [Waterburya agarophytonicola]